MDAAGLRALQAPIKEHYKSEPNSACITLHAKGTLDDAKDAPVGFAKIRLRFDVDTDTPAEKLDQLLKLTGAIASSIRPSATARRSH